MYHIFSRINGQMMKTARKISLYEAVRCFMRIGDAMADSKQDGWVLLLDEHGRLLQRHTDKCVGDKMYGYRDMDEWLAGGFTLACTGYTHDGYATSSVEMKCATIGDADRAMRMLIDQNANEYEMGRHRRGEMTEMILTDVFGKVCRWATVHSLGYMQQAEIEEVDAAEL